MTSSYSSPIVPSFGFGENDLYTILDKPWFRPIQRFYKKYLGFAPILMKGQYGNYFLPYKKKVTLVGRGVIKKNFCFYL